MRPEPALAGERQALAHARLGVRQPAGAEQQLPEVAVAAGRDLVVAVRHRRVHARAHQLETVRLALLEARDPEVVERQGLEIAAAGAAGEVARGGEDRGGALVLVGQREDRAVVQRRVGERGRVARRLEDQHRLGRGRLGRVGLAGHEQVARHAHEALAVRDLVAELRVQRRGGASGVDRLAEAVAVVELPAELVEHRRAIALGQPRQVRGDRLQVRERLAVRPGLRGLAGGERADGDDRLDVARLDRVVHQARQVGPRLGLEGAHDVGVQAPAGERGQAALDRAPRQLVPERQAVRAHLQHAGDLGLRERVDALPEQAPGQLEPDPRRDDAQLVERLAAVRPEPRHARQHGLDHARRDGVGGRGQHLADEERVAAGHPVHGVDVRDRAGGEPLDRGARERPQRDPLHGHARQRPEQPLQRVARAGLVVAEREHEHGPDPLDAAGGVAEHVQRRVVRPVHVLDDEHGRRLRGELLEQRAEQRVDGRVGRQRGGERAVAAERGVVQRPERPRRQQVVAGGEQHPRPLLRPARERPDQARLPDPRLAGHERHRPLPGRRPVHGGVQDRQHLVAFEEVHLLCRWSHDVSRVSWRRRRSAALREPPESCTARSGRSRRRGRRRRRPRARRRGARARPLRRTRSRARRPPRRSRA